MARAVFHKHQRVYVKPVGTWAIIEHVKPQWVKDVEEPVKVFYDCGLGRDFAADDLAAEIFEARTESNWRILRAKNKWQSAEECSHHPHPGSYPVLVTDENNWGGWRVPGAEYDRDPNRIEQQARLLEQAPQLLNLAEVIVKELKHNPELGEDMVELANAASKVIRYINASPQMDNALVDA